MTKINKHKPIRTQEERFIEIGNKTYKVLNQESPNKYRVILVDIKSDFGTKVGKDQKPFIMDVSGLNLEWKCPYYEKK